MGSELVVPRQPGVADRLISKNGKAQRDGVPEVELFVVNDPYDVDGGLLVRAAPGTDQSGRPNVTFGLSKKGGQMMAGLTTDNLPDPDHGRYCQLAIILNGHVFSAPRIQSTIRERGEITGTSLGRRRKIS